MAKNDAAATAAEIHMYMDIYAEECPAELDPELWRRYNYTCGLRNLSLTGMILVSLLFVPLAAVLLCRLPGAASSPAPAPTPAPAEVDTDQGLPTLQQSVQVVWTVSLLVCSYLCFWIYTFSRTMGAAAVFFRVSYGAALAYAAAGLAGPVAGMGVAHLSTAWAAGLLGYALAEYRMHDGGERAADEAAARTPAVRSEGQAAGLIYTVFMFSMMTLFLAALMVGLVFFPSDDKEQDTLVRLVGLSVLVCWILCFWVAVVNQGFLHEALVSGDSFMRVMCYHIGSYVLSILCSLVSPWLWVYYFWLEMMAMTAFFGYILAVNDRRKEILARDKPLLKDLELGDVQEPAQALTPENA